MEQIYKYKKKYLILSFIYMLLLGTLIFWVNSAYPYERKELFLLSTIVVITASLIPFKISKNTVLIKIFGISIFFITPFLIYIIMEFLNNNNALQLGGVKMAMNLFWYYAVYCVLFILSNRTSFALLTGNIFFIVVGIVNQFVLLFKGVPIHPGDILALRTALSVTNAYTFQLNQTMLFAIVICGFMCVLAAKGNLKCCIWKVRVSVDLVLLLIILIYSSVFFDKAYIEKMNVQPYVWSRTQGYIDNGTLLSFMTNIEYLFVDKPEGYTKAAAQKLLSSPPLDVNADSVDSGKKQPTIIAVMNESFSDLSKLGVTDMSSDCLSYFHSMDTPMISGNLFVSIYGGLTSNTEFEFLTGNSMALLPEGTIPFVSFIHDGAKSIIGDLNGKGYISYFVHPYGSTGWNRDINYSCFGVDEAYYIEDFKNSELLRGKISDKNSYEKVIEIYNKNKDNEAPLFIFNVTMQNHGGYDTGYEKSVTLDMQGDYPLAEEYLSILQQSDQALEYLLDYFSNQTSPVIIVFFGDHQPTLEEELWEEVIGNSAEERSIEEIMINYQVPFFIWSNYGLEEKEYSHISANYLSTVLYETAGLRLNDYQVFLKELYQKWPVITTHGCMNAEGEWYQYDDISENEEMVRYQYLEYFELFDN